MIFVAALLAGAVLKTAYTALGCLREVIPHGRIAVEAEDLLYWIAASIFSLCKFTIQVMVVYDGIFY